MWSEILVILCSLITIVVLFFYSGSYFLHLRIFFTISALSVIAGTGGPIFYEQYATDIIEWSKVIGITFSLIVVALLIREMKPVFARFPVFFSYIPLLIIAVYPFISDAQILKDVLNLILQGGTLLIVFLLYLTLINKIDNHLLFLLALVLLAITYGFYWFGGDFISNHPWTWQLPFISGMIVKSLKFADIFQHINSNN